MSPFNIKVVKALLIPVNKKGEVLIQDRENYKPLRWGYFGGSVEVGETVKEALIREAKEELVKDISDAKVVELGIFEDIIGGKEVRRHTFIMSVDVESFKYNVQEGKGAKWVSPEEMEDLMKQFASEADVLIARAVSAFLRKDPNLLKT